MGVTILSGEFVYRFIDLFGGVEKFYSRFFISAVYPFGLIKVGKNFNFYDNKFAYASLKTKILESLCALINFGAKRNAVFCIGKKNAEYLTAFNSEINFFKEIIALDHPRYIMQYRRKKLDVYLNKYMSALNRFK